MYMTQQIWLVDASPDMVTSWAINGVMPLKFGILKISLLLNYYQQHFKSNQYPVLRSATIFLVEMYFYLAVTFQIH